MEEACEPNYTLEDKTKRERLKQRVVDTFSLLFHKITTAFAVSFSSILLPPFMSTHSPISPLSSSLPRIVQTRTPTILFLFAVVDRCLSALDRSVRHLVLIFFPISLCIFLPMFFLEDIWLLVFPAGFRDRIQALSVLLLRTITESTNAPTCVDTESELCRDDSAAFILKFIAMASILVAGVAGIAIPLVGRHRSFLKTDSNLFVAAKAFAAGVILSTGFVHVLSAGSAALSSSCLLTFSQSKFPFSGFFAMLAAVVTLLVDFVGTQYLERMQGLSRLYEENGQVGTLEAGFKSEIVRTEEAKKWSGYVLGEGEGDGMKIAGMHSRGIRNGEEEIDVRHVVVSQILELGIVSHSVVISLSLGVSHSPCTIRPLIAALSFHQFFEGFAHGRCISKAQFDPKTATILACFFASTTPIGIGAGITVASFFNPLSSGALLAEGIFDCLSAGILVYISLVDIIAADFLSKRTRCNFRLQVVSYFMLFFGAGLMSLLAIWA